MEREAGKGRERDNRVRERGPKENERREGTGEDSFKAREEGGRTHLPDLPDTFRDEGARLMVSSSDSSRASLACLG